MSILKKFICLIAIGLIFGQIACSQEYAYNVKNYITTSGRETLLAGELQSLIDQKKMSNFENEIAMPNKELPQVHFKESSMIEIVSSTPANTVTLLLYLVRPETKKVYVQNNNFTYLDVVFDHDELFNIEELKKFNNIDPGRKSFPMRFYKKRL